jgi:hypothetical protein
MKTRKRSGGEERQLLTAVIVDTTVLGRIASQWTDDGLFASKYANLIGTWCVKYYRQYGEAPNKAIENIFESWASKGRRDEETVGLIETLLNSLSDEYEQSKGVNSSYVIDIAERHFNMVRQQRLVSEIQADLDIGDLDASMDRVAKWGKVQVSSSSGIDPMLEMDVWQAAFEESQEPLVVYPGALGAFLGNSLQRDAFVAFTGPEKRGKSWWLQDIAWRAVMQRRRVAFFEVGDMSQNQILMRWGSRAAKRPLYAKDVALPKSIARLPDDKKAEVVTVEKHFEEPLSWKDAYKACQDIMEKKVRSKESYIKLSVHPNSSINVHGIRSMLDAWALQGWVPDVIVIDYADILAPPNNYMEGREQINETWKQLRRTSQEYHCLLVTATQADAASYDTDIIRKRNFTDDKRKHAHVTAMLGINQSQEEAEDGIIRLNFVDRRNEKYNERHCVHIASCLDIANPAVCSCL